MSPFEIWMDENHSKYDFNFEVLLLQNDAHLYL